MYSQFKLCPSGFTSFRQHCYKITTRAKVFSDAEYDCATKNSKSDNEIFSRIFFKIFSAPDQDYNSLLAYPPDYWSLDFMAQLGLSQGQTQLWLGLDARSVHTVHIVLCTHCTHCTLYTLYTFTLYILYTLYGQELLE